MQIWGWFRPEAARASLSKRSSAVLITNEFLGQELERNQPPELQVLRLVHDTHVATTKQLRDSIV